MNYDILFVGLEVLGETRRRFLGAWGLHTVSVVSGALGRLPRSARARVLSLLRATVGMVVTLVLTGCIVLAGQRLL